MGSRSLTDRWVEFLMEKVFMPLMSWVFMPALMLGMIFGIPLLVAHEAGCFGENQEFICGHQPHMGACKETTTLYLYDAATKTVTPQPSSCGCVSSHGVKLETPK